MNPLQVGAVAGDAREEFLARHLIGQLDEAGYLAIGLREMAAELGVLPPELERALEVVAMGRYGRIGWFRRVGRKHREAALAALDRVGMADYAHRQISQLSGGQQQRVFLARALAQDARIYLMDEPFAGVDAATESAIVALLQQLSAAGRTVLVVHHDLQSAAQYFDHVMLLNMRVVAAGPVETTLTEQNLRATYGGRLTLLEEAAHAMAQSRREP